MPHARIARSMARLRTGVFVAVLSTVAALAGCGDALGPDSIDLVGTWTATSAIVTNPANTSQKVDVVAGGLSLTLVIAADDSIELSLGMGADVETATGTLQINGARITLVIDNDRTEGVWVLDGDTLTLDLHTGVEWDFEGDGLDEPATMVIVLVRQ